MPTPFTTLFWNTAGQPREQILSRLVRTHEVDLLVLAECKTPYQTMLGAFHEAGVEYTHHVGKCEAIEV